MNSKEVMELVCDTSFRILVREGKSLQTYITQKNKETVQEAVELIQLLDAQQTVCTTTSIEHNYHSVLDRILFHKD